MSLLVDDALARDCVGWRRHLHRHPELSFQEHQTSRFVAETLGAFGGLEIAQPTATSVVARLRGGRPGSTIALRADLDALPIHEETGVEFASANPGVMHACGHDGHTSMLLAAAKALSARRDEFSGEVRFVFQHAEEEPPGGARELVAAGVMDGVDGVVGVHLWSSLDVGLLVSSPGPQLAAADFFTAEIRGRGGHAALPHQTVDPIAAAAQVVSSVQHIVARQTDPLGSAVVSVTRIQGGTTNNVIPERVEIEGTVRTFDPDVREATQQAFERVLRGVSAAHGATCEIDYRRGYDPVVNDPHWAELVARVGREQFGAEAVTTMDPIMGGEDFSSYLAKTPGAFFFVGARNPDLDAVYPHHHPRFGIDESALRMGTAIFVGTALAALA